MNEGLCQAVIRLSVGGSWTPWSSDTGLVDTFRLCFETQFDSGNVNVKGIPSSDIAMAGSAWSGYRIQCKPLDALSPWTFSDG